MENHTEIERQKFEKAKKRVQAITGFYKHLAAYILVNSFLLGMQALNVDQSEKFFVFSTFSTAFFWGIGLAFHAASIFGKNIFLGNDWEEKKIREIMEKEKASKNYDL